MSLLKRLIGVKRRKHGKTGRKRLVDMTPEEKLRYYEELRKKYLSLGITLEDLYCYFEDRRCMDPEKKKIIKKLIDKHGYLEVEGDFWDWWNLAEDYNPGELRFLYEDD